VLLTADQAFEKLKKYCAYQERCHTEVKQKLVREGFRGAEAAQILAELITDGFLNEERFARSFTRGKFRIKKWGRLKIQAALKAKGVSPACLKKGLSEINDSEYLSTASQLLKKLIPPPAKTNSLDRQKAFRSLRTRGFEPELISRLLGAESAD